MVRTTRKFDIRTSLKSSLNSLAYARLTGRSAGVSEETVRELDLSVVGHRFIAVSADPEVRSPRRPGHTKYRAEIDGLRAIAVLAVILTHAGFRTLRGGFLGVDIFFVLSGYLITKIIHGDLIKGSFSILEFYDRRIRRIFPALLVMMLLCAPVAYHLMLPDDLENFGQSLVATTLFSNNVLLFLTSGYFALASDFKPLVHTWSLGVEEHYYIVVPLLMLIAFRLGRNRATLAGIMVFSVVSFAVCLWLSRVEPDANFYLILSRAWQIAAGALVALTEPAIRRRINGGRSADLLAFLGLVAILASLALFHAGMSLPSWPTLLPVGGVCLVLMFASEDGVTTRLLSLKPLVFIGLISYSLYLYHQPVLGFARIASLEQPSAFAVASLIPLIFVLAYLSWRFVEQPFRNRTLISGWKVVGLSALSGSLLIALGITMHLTSGFYRNWPELAEADSGFGAHQNAEFNVRPFRYKGVVLNSGTGKTSLLVLGTSFARDFINMGIESGNLAHHDISYSDVGDCQFPLPADVAHNARMAEFIVLGSGISREHQGCFERRIRELRALGNARIVVLGTKSFGWNNNAIMLLDPSTRYTYRTRPLSEAVQDNTEASKRFPEDLYVDILKMIGDQQGRVPVFTPDRKFISQDRTHLTQAGARYVGGIVFQHPALRDLSRGMARSEQGRGVRAALRPRRHREKG